PRRPARWRSVSGKAHRPATRGPRGAPMPHLGKKTRRSWASILHVEPLEDRRLLSGGPAWLALSPPSPPPTHLEGQFHSPDVDVKSAKAPEDAGHQGLGAQVSDWATNGIHGQELAAHIHLLQDSTDAA